MKKRIYTDPTIASSDITPEAVFLNRRNLIKSAATGMASAMALDVAAEAGQSTGTPLGYTADPDQSLAAERTPYDAVTSYNNFYEFGTDKVCMKDLGGQMAKQCICPLATDRVFRSHNLW